MNRKIKKYLSQYIKYYPDIIKWYKKKVMPNIGKDRNVLVLYEDGHIVAITIAKIDEDKQEYKICHLSVASWSRGIGIGRFLFHYHIKEARKKKLYFLIHHTLSSKLSAIFEKYGFFRNGWDADNKDIIYIKK